MNKNKCNKKWEMGHSTVPVFLWWPSYGPGGHRGDPWASLLWRRAAMIALELSKLSDPTYNGPLFRFTIALIMAWDSCESCTQPSLHCRSVSADRSAMAFANFNFRGFIFALFSFSANYAKKGFTVVLSCECCIPDHRSLVALSPHISSLFLTYKWYFWNAM